MRLAVVIPCFNEDKNLINLVEAIKYNFGSNENIHVFLVNNGSTDASYKTMQRLTAQNKHITVVNLENNKGYGYGIKKGLREAKDFDLICWTHADLQTDLSDVVRAREIYLNENDEEIFIKGKRINRNYIEMLLSVAMQFFASICLRTYITEINAQPKLMSRDFYLKNEIRAPDDFSLDLYFLYQAKKHKLKIIDFPVSFLERRFGEAKGGSGSSLAVRLRLIKRTVKYILKLRLELK